jgi:hypothetical protein
VRVCGSVSARDVDDKYAKAAHVARTQHDEANETLSAAGGG